jgi:hypothetical protein
VLSPGPDTSTSVADARPPAEDPTATQVVGLVQPARFYTISPILL